jgi:hypothetical protein
MDLPLDHGSGGQANLRKAAQGPTVAVDNHLRSPHRGRPDVQAYPYFLGHWHPTKRVGELCTF